MVSGRVSLRDGLPRLAAVLALLMGLLASSRDLGAQIVSRGDQDGQREQGRPAQPSPSSIRDLQLAPPRVQRLGIRVLEKEERDSNVAVEVEFEGRDRRRVGRKLELDVEGQTIELRDDGQQGDLKEGDGRFSTLLKVDLAELEAALNRGREPANEKLLGPGFNGRVRLVEAEQVALQPLKLNPGVTLDLGLIPLLPPGPFPPAVDAERSLLIRHLSVVEDPTRTFDPCASAGNPIGKWTFGHLMTQICNTAQTGIKPADFVRRWLRRWEFNQLVNDFPITARPRIRDVMIRPWEDASGGPGSDLDLTRAPFRLLAIVNRVDLRDNFLYGGGSAGEARFVFCAIDLRPGPGCGADLPFTVIFEYGIKKKNCAELKAWATAWANLSKITLGDPQFNHDLELITDQFTSAGADPTRLPNQSALNQLRTNEIALDSPWELREFTLDSNSVAGHLEEATTKQTPDGSFLLSTVLSNFVNSNVTAILADRHVVPAIFPGSSPFLGGNAITDPVNFFWDGPTAPLPPMIGNRDARFHFSLNTCNGCHGGETATKFLHIRPRAAGSMAGLSGFLTGIVVADVADGAPTRGFNDLDRRRKDLQKLVLMSCHPFFFFMDQIRFRPLRMTH